jgi:hypothetical protein
LFTLYNKNPDKSLVIYTIGSDCVNDCEDEYKILYRKEHYSVVKSFEAKSIDPDHQVENVEQSSWILKQGKKETNISV